MLDDTHFSIYKPSRFHIPLDASHQKTKTAVAGLVKSVLPQPEPMMYSESILPVEDCSICYGGYGELDHDTFTMVNGVQLPCGHRYHERCWNACYQHQRTKECPECRYPTTQTYYHHCEQGKGSVVINHSRNPPQPTHPYFPSLIPNSPIYTTYFTHITPFKFTPGRQIQFLAFTPEHIRFNADQLVRQLELVVLKAPQGCEPWNSVLGNSNDNVWLCPGNMFSIKVTENVVHALPDLLHRSKILDSYDMRMKNECEWYPDRFMVMFNEKTGLKETWPLGYTMIRLQPKVPEEHSWASKIWVRLHCVRPPLRPVEDKSKPSTHEQLHALGGFFSLN